MYASLKKYLLVLCILSTGTQTAVAVEDTLYNTDDMRIAPLPYYSYGQGLGITSPDSLYQLKIRFRMQNRFTYQEQANSNPAVDGQIRRLRLRFDGYVGDPRFLYAIQLSFAPGDVGETEEGKNINIIRDAIVFYRPNKHWSFGFGQTKLPGNRQRVNSSGALQFTDRSINNIRFNIDRDFGFQMQRTHMFPQKFSWNLKGAITMGEGRNWTNNKDHGLALTGKIELYPLGTFSKNGDFFEGDQMREPMPKLLISAAFHHNHHAKRTQGQLGDDLYAPRTMQSLLADLMFKYKGWAFMSAYMNRTAANPLTFEAGNPGMMRYVFTGQGVDLQGSRLFKNNFEILARYSWQQVHRDIHAFAPHTQQWSAGLTKYIWEHAFKLQSELSFQQEDYIGGFTKDSWYIRFQVEIGI